MGRHSNLTEDEKIVIRRLVREEKLSQSAVARVFNISSATVHNVISDYPHHAPKRAKKPKFVGPAVTDPSLLKKLTAGRA